MKRRDFVLAGVAGPLALALPERSAATSVGGTPLALVTADHQSHVVALEIGADRFESGRIVKRIRTLPWPRSIEAAFQTWAVVAHTELGRLSILHAPSLAVRRTVDGFRAPRYTAVHPTLFESGSGSPRALAYVTDEHLRQVVTIDVVRGRMLWRTTVPGPARHVSVSPDGASLWTSLGSKAERVAVLDLEDPRRPRLQGTFAPPFLGHDVVFAPDGKHVWVTSGDRGRIAIYEASGHGPVAVLDADAPPQHVAFRGQKAFVASGDDGTMRLHAADGRLLDLARVPVGSYNVTSWHVSRTCAVTPSLGQGTLASFDARGRVIRVRRIARAAHDACLVVG